MITVRKTRSRMPLQSRSAPEDTAALATGLLIVLSCARRQASDQRLQLPAAAGMRRRSIVSRPDRGPGRRARKRPYAARIILNPERRTAICVLQGLWQIETRARSAGSGRGVLALEARMKPAVPAGEKRRGRRPAVRPGGPPGRASRPGAWKTRGTRITSWWTPLAWAADPCS